MPVEPTGVIRDGLEQGLITYRTGKSKSLQTSTPTHTSGLWGAAGGEGAALQVHSVKE